MASLRTIKRDIDNLVNEVVTDAYLALYFNSNKRDEVVKIMTDAVALRNELFEMVNNPADKHDRKLVRKHFAAVNDTMFTRIDGLFAQLADTVKA